MVGKNCTKAVRDRNESGFKPNKIDYQKKKAVAYKTIISIKNCMEKLWFLQADK